MSSASSFNTIRRHSSNAADIRLKELTQELAKTRSDLAGSQLETDDVRSQGRMDHSTIKVNDERLKFVTTLSSLDPDFTYEFPTEPDFNFLKVWFMLDHLGARMRDMSGFGNDAFILGHPTLRRAGLDIGFQQTGAIAATPVMLLNSGTDVVSQRNGEYIFIADHTSIQFTQFPVGFSIAFRFNCLNFDNHISQDNLTFIRRFAAKTDDPSNGWNLVLYQTDTTGLNGVLEMQVVHNGVTYKRRRVGFNVNAWYQVVVTYDPNLTADQRIKIYAAGAESTTAGTASLILPTHTNLRIGARDGETGFYQGYLHDFRLYMGKILTQTEVTNLDNNEMTIDNITKGHVFVVQYAMVSTLMRSKTHKYQIGGYLTKNRIHKFNIIKKLVLTRTHKYNMVTAVPVQTQTHKYDIVGMIFRLRTHRYGLGGTVRVEKTHKYNMDGNPLLVQVVRFQKNASGSNGATQDVTLNFTPKAIQVISVATTTDNASVAHYQYCHGFSDGTNHACAVSVARDAVGTTETARSHRNDSVIARLNDVATTTLTCRASVAFSTNKVTFTWDVNDTNAIWITMWAIGGLGISNAKVNTVSVGRTTTGVQSYTGLGFNPVQDQSVLFTLANNAVASGTHLNLTNTNSSINLGCAVSTTKRWSVANESPSGQTFSYSDRRTSNAHVIAEINQANGLDLYSANFNGWITDGFELNFTSAPPASTYLFSYLVIKGGRWDAGVLTAPTSITANVDYAVAVNTKTPKSLMIAGTANIVHDIVTAGILSLGVTDGTTQNSIGLIDEYAQDISDTYRTHNATSVIKLIGTNGVLSDEAVLDSFSANNFRLDWTTKSANAQFYGWVVVAEI